jgi:hypothetical protein
MDTPGKWGTNRKGGQVHYFVRRTDNGRCESLCGRMKNFDEGVNARLDMEHWDPEDERTCKTCRSLLRWFKSDTLPKKIHSSD